MTKAQKKTVELPNQPILQERVAQETLAVETSTVQQLQELRQIAKKFYVLYNPIKRLWKFGSTRRLLKKRAGELVYDEEHPILVQQFWIRTRHYKKLERQMLKFFNARNVPQVTFSRMQKRIRVTHREWFDLSGIPMEKVKFIAQRLNMQIEEQLRGYSVYIMGSINNNPPKSFNFYPKEYVEGLEVFAQFEQDGKLKRIVKKKSDDSKYQPEQQRIFIDPTTKRFDQVPKPRFTKIRKSHQPEEKRQEQ